MKNLTKATLLLTMILSLSFFASKASADSSNTNPTINGVLEKAFIGPETELVPNYYCVLILKTENARILIVEDIYDCFYTLKHIDDLGANITLPTQYLSQFEEADLADLKVNLEDAQTKMFFSSEDL
jgi:hypothetical protein